MMVVKRSDQQEKFSLEKLSISIAAANSETQEKLDIGLLLAEFQNLVVDKEYITTGQITVLVCGLLYTKGARETLEHYYDFVKK